MPQMQPSIWCIIALSFNLHSLHPVLFLLLFIAHKLPGSLIAEFLSTLLLSYDRIILCDFSIQTGIYHLKTLSKSAHLAPPII